MAQRSLLCGEDRSPNYNQLQTRAQMLAEGERDHSISNEQNAII